MNKAQLIEAVANDAKMTKAEAKWALEAVIGATTKALSNTVPKEIRHLRAMSRRQSKTVTGMVITIGTAKRKTFSITCNAA